jgi:hypothetical protein
MHNYTKDAAYKLIKLLYYKLNVNLPLKPYN